MSCYNNAKYRYVYMHVLQITLRYLLIAEIIEMAQPAPMVNLPRSPLYYYSIIYTVELLRR